MNANHNDLMTIREVSDKTGFGRSTIMKWIKNGHVSNHQTDDAPNAPVLLSFAEVDDYVKSTGTRPRSTATKERMSGAIRTKRLRSLDGAREQYLAMLEKTADSLRYQIEELESKRAELRRVEGEIAKIKELL